MIAYRILHKPTGLFYCPSREIKVSIDDEHGNPIERRVKSNLSKTGKAYARKPSLKHIGSTIYTHLVTRTDQLNNRKYCVVPVIDEQWEIQEI